MLLSEIAEKLGLETRGGDVDILRPSLVEDAGSGCLCLATSAKYARQAESAGVAALLTSDDVSTPLPVIVSPKPRLAFAGVLALFDHRPGVPVGVDATANVSRSASIDPTAAIGPNVCIEENVRIGAGVEVCAGCFIGAGSVLGSETRLGPGAVVYYNCLIGERVRIQANTVIGSEGYGYEFDGERHVPVPHIGRVIIEDDVEIGANCCVDRAKTGATVIGAGSKIDNLVQVGHGVVIGPGTLLAGQVGIGGSTKIGAFSILAGQVGVADNTALGDRTIVTAQSGVVSELEGREMYMGTPARKVSEMRRILAALTRLPDLVRRVRALEQGGNESKNR